jgi:hypothetical protein
MPFYTEEQRARLVALPSAMLLATLVMEAVDPMVTLRNVIDEMRYVVEVKQAYPDNALIQGVFQDVENPLPGLDLSFTCEREVILNELRQYIKETSMLLSDDIEAKEFKAFLAVMTEMVAEDVEQGRFGSDPVIEQAQVAYLRTLKQQFSLPPSMPKDDKPPSDAYL